MKYWICCSAVVLLIGVVGCSNPADSVPAAAVAPASATAADAAADAADVKDVEPVAAGEAEARDGAVEYFAFGPESSKIEFVGSKVTGSHEGGFREFAGEVAVQGDRLADDGVHVVIDTNSLWSDSERLTGHLKNPDFFDVEKYPTSTFVSTKIAETKNGVEITGDLTLHGVTKSITFPATVEVQDDQIRLASEFSINRFDFAMQYSGKADDLIRKEVVIRFDVEATPGRADFPEAEASTADRAVSAD